MKIACKNRLFSIPIERFRALHRNHFESGWEWLTIAAHNQKWLIKKIYSATQSIGPISVAIYYQLYENACQLIADTQA